MLLQINSRPYFFSRCIDLVKDRPGHWSGTVADNPFTIEGGKQAGGTAREWFVECPNWWNGSIRTHSLVHALRLLDKC